MEIVKIEHKGFSEATDQFVMKTVRVVRKPPADEFDIFHKYPLFPFGERHNRITEQCQLSYHVEEVAEAMGGLSRKVLSVHGDCLK